MGFDRLHLRLSLLLLCGILLTSLAAPLFADGDVQRQHLEAEGFDLEARSNWTAGAALVKLGGGATGGVLLVPESSNDRVMAFDPETGDLVDADYIPADPDNLSTPIHAILNAGADGFLISDQIEDVVQEYDLDGNFVGTFAPIGGPDTSILDNIRGMVLRPNGNLLVTVGSGSNADAVAEFDTAGSYLGNFIANAAGGLGSPFDIILRSSDYLVCGIDSDTIHSFDLSGTAQPDFAAIDNFPEQLAETPSGNVLVADFGGTQQGVVELTSAGALVGVYDPAALGGYRGVYELGNGNILTTNGSGVHEIDRLGNLVETKISGVNARFIEHVVLDAIFSDGFESGDTTSWSSTVP